MISTLFNDLLKIRWPLAPSRCINALVMNENTFYKTQLKKELAARIERNPRYSIRAFSKALDIDVGAFSRILSGKQIPSFKLAQKILSGLDLQPEDLDRFMDSIAQTQRSRNLERLSPLVRKYQQKSKHPKTADLSIDLYRIIADWYHFAILELTFVDEFQSHPRFIAKELGITVTEASLAVERLMNFGLLQEQDGVYIKTDVSLSTADKHLTTPALRKNQKQFLEKAIHSLENDPIEERNMSSMTMAIDPEKLPVAKQMIREFNQALCKFLESGKRKRVYNMEIALYPLQTKNKTKNKPKGNN